MLSQEKSCKKEKIIEQKKRSYKMFKELQVENVGGYGQLVADWMDKNGEICRQAAEKAAKAGLVEAPFPEWIVEVPEDRQEAALLSHVDGLIRRKDRIEANRKEREERREAKKVVVDQLREAGFQLTYSIFDEVRGLEPDLPYHVALAYRVDNDVFLDRESEGASDDEIAGVEPGEYSDVMVYFSICSPVDIHKFSRHEARIRLLDRVAEDDDVHSFSAMIPRSVLEEKGKLSPIVWGRFMEYVFLGGKGIPQHWPYCVLLKREGM